ncbi:conserved hypothetical protein, partial [Stigmatella aurantiaca DW4/3-1]
MTRTPRRPVSAGSSPDESKPVRSAGPGHPLSPRVRTREARGLRRRHSRAAPSLIEAPRGLKRSVTFTTVNRFTGACF